jgi:hypothetical protein
MEFYFILGILILPGIIYYTVKGAVEEGTYNALIKFEKYKKKNVTLDN